MMMSVSMPILAFLSFLFGNSLQGPDAQNVAAQIQAAQSPFEIVQVLESVPAPMQNLQYTDYEEIGAGGVALHDVTIDSPELQEPLSVKEIVLRRLDLERAFEDKDPRYIDLEVNGIHLTSASVPQMAMLQQVGISDPTVDMKLAYDAQGGQFALDTFALTMQGLGSLGLSLDMVDQRPDVLSDEMVDPEQMSLVGGSFSYDDDGLVDKLMGLVTLFMDATPEQAPLMATLVVDEGIKELSRMPGAEHLIEPAKQVRAFVADSANPRKPLTIEFSLGETGMPLPMVEQSFGSPAFLQALTVSASYGEGAEGTGATEADQPETIVTDADGNQYVLYPDGTYEAVEAVDTGDTAGAEDEMTAFLTTELGNALNKYMPELDAAGREQVIGCILDVLAPLSDEDKRQMAAVEFDPKGAFEEHLKASYPNIEEDFVACVR